MSVAHPDGTDHRPVETMEAWPEIRAALETHSIADVADRFGLTSAALRAAVRRTGGGRIRVVRPVPAPEPAPEPAPAAELEQAADEPTERRERPSPAADKVLALGHLLGVEADRVVAEKAGVSIGTVRNIRRDRGIAAAPKRRRKKTSARRRTAVAKPTPQREQAPPVVAEAPPEPVRPVVAETPPEQLWRVVFGFGGNTSSWTVVGASIADAAARAEQAGVLGVLRIEWVGPAV